MSTLAVDQGTSSTRAMVLNDQGETRVVKVLEHRQIYPRPGWVEHDPEELLANIRACIAAAGDVDAIGIDNQGESCLAWHRGTGQAVSPVIVWQDDRTQDLIEQLKSDGAETLVLEKTGLPLDPYFSASKLAWILANTLRAGELLASGELCLGTTDAFFLQRLTGRFVTDITTASRTSLMNLESGDWDPELCELFGVPAQALPRIVTSRGDFGEVRAQGRSIPITASIVDQQASLFGHGCRNEGDVKITFGTGAFALAVTGNRSFRAPDRGLLPTVAWQFAGDPPVYALDGGVYSASSALNWARSLGLFSDFDQINAFDGPSAAERELVFVPALTGMACPHWDRRARGLWAGLSLDTTALDMVRAILEGVAFRGAEVLSAMNEYVPLSGAVSVDGGMSRNPYFCQFLADLLQREVAVPGLGELTAAGTAMLARHHDGGPVAMGESPTVYLPGSDRQGHRERFSEAIRLSRAW